MTVPRPNPPRIRGDSSGGVGSRDHPDGRCVLGGVHLTSSPPRWLSLINKGFSLPLCYLNLMGIGCTPPISRLTDSVALYMCRASPVRVESARAEFSYENFLLTLTDNFNQLYDFLTTKLS